MRKVFSTQNINVPPVQSVKAPNALHYMALSPRGSPEVRPPVIVPTPALCIQAPFANIPIIPKNNTNNRISPVRQNIPFETTPVPMTVPYETTFAPITTTTHGINPVRSPQYATFENSAMVENPGLPRF